MKRFIIILAIFFQSTIFCDPSTVDTSFNGVSYVTTSIGSNPTVHDIEIQSDGKFVITGQANNRAFVARYNQDKTLDTSFNGTGYVINSLFSYSHGITIQSDQKIIIAGRAVVGDAFIARYNTNGSLDTSFGSGLGYVITQIGVFSQATDIEIQSNGKIIICGYSTRSFSLGLNRASAQPEQTFVARYNTNGTLDTSFGSGLGYTTTTPTDIYQASSIDFTEDAEDIICQANNVTLDIFGRLVVTGTIQLSESTQPQSFIIRYSTTGSLDLSFGVITEIGARSYSYDILIQPDRKILITGEALFRDGMKAFIARYNTNGSVDTSFSNGLGYVTLLVGKNSLSRDITLLENGNIIMVGYNTTASGIKNALIANYKPDGSLNTKFNKIGYLSISLGSNVQASCITTYKNNTIVAGYTNNQVVIGNYNIAGHTLTEIGSSSTAYNIKTQPDNKIIVAGYVTIDTIKKFLVARYLENGYLDSSFNASGYNLTSIGSTDAIAYKTTLQSDGKIVATGTANNQIMVTRYLTDGSLDSSFNSDETPGYIISSFGTNSQAYDLAIQSDGKIIVSGYATTSGIKKIVIARYNSDGTLDTTFGSSNGYTLTSIGSSVTTQGLAIQSTGKIIVAGYATISGVQKIIVARYSSNGIIDTTFGTNGYTSTLIGTDCQAHSLILQPNNKIIVTGNAQVSNIKNIMLARYTSNGTLDTTFGTNGYVTKLIGTQAFANFITTQADNNLLVSGQATVSGINQIFLARYTPSGSLDTTFNSLGYTTTPIGSDVQAFSLCLQSNQKILVTGYANITGSNHITIIGYLGGLASSATQINAIGSKVASVVSNYGEQHNNLSTFLNLDFYANKISDVETRDAIITTMNNILLDYISQNTSQENFNFILNLNLITPELQSAQKSLITTYPDYTTEINQFFININTKINNLTIIPKIITPTKKTKNNTLKKFKNFF